jgi:hypothetical protein
VCVCARACVCVCVCGCVCWGGSSREWRLECAVGILPVGMQSLGSLAAKQAQKEEVLFSLRR